MSKYKVKYFNHISVSDYTLAQADELVKHLDKTFKDCDARIIVEIKEKSK